MPVSYCKAFGRLRGADRSHRPPPVAPSGSAPPLSSDLDGSRAAAAVGRRSSGRSMQQRSVDLQRRRPRDRGAVERPRLWAHLEPTTPRRGRTSTGRRWPRDHAGTTAALRPRTPTGRASTPAPTCWPICSRHGDTDTVNGSRTPRDTVGTNKPCHSSGLPRAVKQPRAAGPRRDLRSEQCHRDQAATRAAVTEVTAE